MFMSDYASAKILRRRALAELVKLDLDVARELHERAMRAKTTDELIELVNAFDEVSRTVRDAIALQAKLAREGEAAAPDPDLEERLARRSRLAVRRRRLAARSEPAADPEPPPGPDVIKH